LIPVIDLSRLSRLTRRALLSLENFDPQVRAVIYGIRFMSSEQIHGERKLWTDPV
jgi:hypothetical protein